MSENLYLVALVLIALVVLGVIYKYVSSKIEVIVMATAILALLLWICYDKLFCTKPKLVPVRYVHISQEQRIKHLVDDINNADDEDDRASVTSSQSSTTNTKSDVSDVSNTTDVTDITNSEPEGMGTQIPPPFYLKNKSKENIKLTKFDVNEFDIDYYSDPSKEFDIRLVYNEQGGQGDTMICNRAKYQGMQAKLSMDIRAIYNKHTIEPYFQEELKEQADKIWWEAEDNTYGPL